MNRREWSARPNRESLRRRNPKLAAFVLARDRRCVYCKSTKNLQVDHLVPRSKGGTDDVQNLASCCKRCNCSKQAKSVYEWSSYAKSKLGLLFDPNTVIAHARKETKKMEQLVHRKSKSK